MHVRYCTRRDQHVPVYVCVGRGRLFGDPLCQSIAGTQLDAAIGELIVGAVTPMAIEQRRALCLSNLRCVVTALSQPSA
jgi:hypothetical protein